MNDRAPALPVIAAWAGDRLCAEDGAEWSGGPPPKPWRRRPVYVVGAAPWSAILARLAVPGDTVAGANVGTIQGATIAGVRLHGGAAWALPTGPAEAAEAIASMRAAAAEAGIAWAASAGACAGALLADHARGEGWAGQLRPRWRGVSRASLFQGPMVAASAGGPDCVALDRRAAYLHGLRALMPIAAGYRIVRPGTPWASLRRAHADGQRGAVAAVVRVWGEAWDGRLCGPLPVRTLSATRWPAWGTVAGTWTVGTLAAAEAAGGVEVLRVAGGAVAPSAPILARVADRIEAIDHKPLRKALYTRAWGVLAYEGWPEGEIRPAAEAATAPGVWTPIAGACDRAVAWTDTGGRGYSHACPPIFRPDLAAHVAGDNVEAMIAAIAAAGPAAAMALVDSLFLTDPGAAEAVAAAAPRGGGWAEKGRGPCEIAAVGVYRLGGIVRAMGAPAGLAPAQRWAAATAIASAADPLSAARIAGRLQGAPGAEACGHHPGAARVALPGRGRPWTPRGWLADGESVEETSIMGECDV